MARLIEVQEARACPSPLTVRQDDVLLFHASGGHVRSGGTAIELVGPLLTAVLGDDGTILTPMGAPNVILFRAHGPGESTIDIVTGDPWSAPQAIPLLIIVMP
jgi:hypothetical protein